jgi:hypothetical protein
LLTVDELALLYIAHAEQYYRKNGAPTSEVWCVRAALRFLINKHGTCHARAFGPTKPHELAEEMQQEASVTAESFTGVNRVAGRNRHAATNGKQHTNRLNGNRRANILETIGALAEG